MPTVRDPRARTVAQAISAIIHQHGVNPEEFAVLAAAACEEHALSLHEHAMELEAEAADSTDDEEAECADAEAADLDAEADEWMNVAERLEGGAE